MLTDACTSPQPAPLLTCPSHCCPDTFALHPHKQSQEEAERCQFRSRWKDPREAPQAISRQAGETGNLRNLECSWLLLACCVRKIRAGVDSKNQHIPADRSEEQLILSFSVQIIQALPLTEMFSVYRWLKSTTWFTKWIQWLRSSIWQWCK